MKKSAAEPLSVSIILPNWNGKKLLEKHLPRVLEASDGAQVIVADDASDDGSVGFLRAMFPSVEVVVGKKRQGFSGNVNAGVAQARGDVVILLNTDVLPHPGFIRPILADFSDPEIFAVGCMEESHEQGKIVLRGRGTARWEKGFFIHERGEVDADDTAWVNGGTGAFRRSMWNELGGMNTLYNPFYWEDIDLSYRALKAGYRLKFERASVVGHFHEEGAIKVSFDPGRVRQIAYRNQFIFLWKNMSETRLWISHLFRMPVRLIRAFISRDADMILGFGQAFLLVPRIIRSRAAESRLWRRQDTAVVPLRSL